MIKIGRVPAVLIVIGVAAVAAIGGTVWGVAAQRACQPPEEQRHLLEAYEADPAYDVAPAGGDRLSDEARFAACRQDFERVPRENRPLPFDVATTVTYRIPASPTPRELYKTFRERVENAGWELVSYSEPDVQGGQVTFCKMINYTVSELTISPWGEPDGSYRLGVMIFTPLDTLSNPHQRPTVCPSPTTMRERSAS